MVKFFFYGGLVNWQKIKLENFLEDADILLLKEGYEEGYEEGYLDSRNWAQEELT